MAAFAFIAQTAVDMPPPTMRGPHFACRMTDRAGETFTVSGQLGSGRRYNTPTATMRPTWFYRYDRAVLEDSGAGFAGAPIFAQSSAGRDDLWVMVRYAAGRNGRRIDISEGGQARLTEDNTGDVLADGTCRIEFERQVASKDMETRR